MISLNYLNKILKDFATNHNQIRTYFFGNIVNNKQTNISYPLLWTIETGIIINQNTVVYELQVFCLDRFQGGFINENDVYNDCSLILQDLKVYLQENLNHQIVLDDVVQLEKIGDEINSDLVGGWRMECKIQVPLNTDVCDIPGNNDFDFPTTN